MSWPNKAIEDICSVVYAGGTPKASNEEFYGGAIPWLRTQEVVFNRILDTEIKITEKGLNGSPAKWVPENSIIVAMYGNSAGRVAINGIPLTTNQACCNLVVDPDLADYRYVFFALKGKYEELKYQSKGSAQNNLNAAQVKAFKIPCPDVITQREIADILSGYDDLIENNRRRIQLLEESARLLYREWFVHLRFPGHEHVKVVGGVPEGWERRTVSEVCDILSGGTPKTSVEEYWGGDIPFFTPKDATDSIYARETEKTLTESGLNSCSSQLYSKNTIFITARGTVGRLNLAQVPMAMNQSCYALMAKEPLNQFVLYFGLQAGIEYLKNQAVGAVFDAIIRDTFKRIPFLLPSEGLLTEFSETVTPIIQQIDNLSEQNRKLAEARDLLLPRLMNGEIAV